LYGETSVEQFSRYIRLWTRGYDTYTPTTNVAYQNNIDPQNSTIGNTEWTIHTDEKYRVQAINRAKMIAQIPIIDGTMVMIPSETMQANFGLYGLGKRRTLQQFNEFLKRDVPHSLFTIMEYSKHSPSSSTVRCDDHTWVPYDSSILPTANLFNEPDNLDPQPIYPLRTRLLYYQQEIVFDADFGNATEHVQHHLHNSNYQFITKDPYDDMPSLTALASMWITGLAAWYVLFFVLSKPLSSGKRRKPKFAYDQDALSPSLATSCKESDDGADKQALHYTINRTWFPSWVETCPIVMFYLDFT
jgi:Glycosyltransferase (GlcNAc)